MCDCYNFFTIRKSTYHTSDGSTNQPQSATDETTTLCTGSRSHHRGDDYDANCSHRTTDDVPHATCQPLAKVLGTCLLQNCVQLFLGFLLLLELLLPGLPLLCFV